MCALVWLGDAMMHSLEECMFAKSISARFPVPPQTMNRVTILCTHTAVLYIGFENCLLNIECALSACVM